MKDHTAAPIPMTEEQKFFFDLRGWILLPSVLTEEEIEETKALCYAGASRSSSKGFMHRAFSSLVTARERQARRYVNGYLLSLDDATLAAYGYDRAELERQGSATSAF